MDEEGLIPEALAQSLEHRGARVLYTIPTLQNPTSATQPLQRRREIVEICRAKGVVIIEDDVFGHYRPDAPLPYLAIAPDITYSLASLSKTIAPGLRISFLAFPESERARVAAALQATAVMAPPLMAELAAQMIEDGTASRLLAARRKEAIARGQLVQKILAPWNPAIPAGAITAWLTLPEPWRAQEFAAAALREGVVISPAEHFTLSRHVDAHAVRLCLGPPKSQDQLRQALKTLARLLDSPPLALNQTML
jgi:DNA-binding transcriptional MocR family regulator